ncbi:hypothetical protein [Bradyrhizobium barranii]
MQFRLLLAVGRLEGVDLEPRAAEPGLGLIDGDLVGLRVNSKQDLALPDALVVANGDLDRLAGHPRVDGDFRGAHERIVGRDVLFLRQIHEGAERGSRGRHHEHQGPAQPPGKIRAEQQRRSLAPAEAAIAQPAGHWRKVQTHRPRPYLIY